VFFCVITIGIFSAYFDGLHTVGLESRFLPEAEFIV
jgi:hypothetical protein